MEHPQTWMPRFSYRNATFLVCFFNLITALLLLHGVLSSTTSRKARTYSFDYEQLRSARESEQIRRALEPLELIKRVREIELEAYTEVETVPQIVPTQTAAAEISKKLTGSRNVNGAHNQKALEEWLRRKMERARHQELEKNATTVSQA